MQRLGCVALLFTGATAAFSYGPNGCVHVSRSSEGSCVFQTSCLKDIADVEFSFICSEASGEQVEHIFERGALTKSDHWDTSVKCKKCVAPTMRHVLAKTHDEDADEDTDEDADAEKEKDSAKENTTAAENETATENKTADEEAKKAEEAKAVEELKDTAVTMVAVPPSYAAFYGPGGCVTTYKGPSGSCIMETSCEGEDMADFTYGLMCVDSKGERVRHVFMGDAFDPVESFDTLIECDLCLGLDSAGSVGLGQEVGALKDEVKALATKVEDLEKASHSQEEETTSTASNSSGANASMLIHTGLRMTKYRAANDEDATPAPATAAESPKPNEAAADVEVDVIHHNHESKFLKSKERITLSSHSDWDPLSMRLRQPRPKRAQRPGPRVHWSK